MGKLGMELFIFQALLFGEDNLSIRGAGCFIIQCADFLGYRPVIIQGFGCGGDFISFFPYFFDFFLLYSCC